MAYNNGFRIFGGSSNPGFESGVCRYLRKERDIKVYPGGIKLTAFSDGEPRVEIEENVRGLDVFLIQSTCRTPDCVALDEIKKKFPEKDFSEKKVRGYSQSENLMELLLMIDAAIRSSANRVTAVIPYYGFGRQDKKDQPRVPFSARLVADLIQEAGAHRAIFMDLHSDQTQGFFKIPSDQVYASKFMLEHIRRKFGEGEHLVVVSPDAGGVKRARAYAKRLSAGLAIIDKRRSGPNESKVMHVIGDVKDKIAIIIDDMSDTSGTATEGAAALMKKGAKEIHCAFSHPVFSGPAIERIDASPIKSIFVTDSIPLSSKARKCQKSIEVVSACPLIGEVILRSYQKDSVTSLFV